MEVFKRIIIAVAICYALAALVAFALAPGAASLGGLVGSILASAVLSAIAIKGLAFYKTHQRKASGYFVIAIMALLGLAACDGIVQTLSNGRFG